MKILFLTLDINLANETGDSIHVRELATNLSKLGNEVFLITAHTNENSSSLNWSKSVPNLHLFFNKTRRIFNNISTLIFCRKIAKKYGVQIIYERRASPKIGVALGKLFRIPAVIELNGLPGLDDEIFGRVDRVNSITRTFRRSILRHLFRYVDGVVAVTPRIKREVIKNYKVKSDKIFVVPNGANLNLFKPMNQNLCKEKLGLNMEDKYVCYVGNLAPWQGLEFLIKASPIVLEKDTRARFLLVGDGVMGDTIKKMVKNINISDKFLFTGRIPYEKVPEFINSSDICVAPFIKARNEKIGLSPLKVYEYLACGKPIVASDIEGVGDFLKKTNSGITVEPENHESLAEGIIDLLQNKDKGREMGMKGREIVNREHGWDSTAKKVMAMCKLLA